MAHRSDNLKADASSEQPLNNDSPLHTSSEHSLIQNWERSEDVQLPYSNVDLMDNWSSDGDSASSCSTESESSLNELNGNTQVSSQSKIRVNLLKQARVFTTQEAIDQAIDRWQAYQRSCSRALDVLRHQMVEAYIPFALEQHRSGRLFSEERIPLVNETKNPTNQRRKALRNMLRHSVKVANQQHLACVSKFASVSHHLAPWRKSGMTPRCRFRDPTTTTWEKPCENLCVPLLSVCAVHLVQLHPAPQSPIVECLFKSEAPSETIGGTLARSTPRVNRFVGYETSDANALIAASPANCLPLPTQYLFRQCGGGPEDKPCAEPVIGWTAESRCYRHTRR